MGKSSNLNDMNNDQDNFVIVMNKGNTGQKCYHCKKGENGHSVKLCTKQVKDRFCAYCKNKSFIRRIPCKPHTFNDSPRIRCKKCDGNHCESDWRNVPCTKCGLISHKARDCNEELCAKCNSPNHYVEDCKKCEYCHENGHIHGFKTDKGKYIRTWPYKYCGVCREYGDHFTSTCSDALCKICKEYGHTAGSCELSGYVIRSR